MAKPGSYFRAIIEGIGGAIFIAVVLLLSLLLRRWYSRWGSQKEEISARIPGDELVPEPRIASTRAITIHAPPKDIYLWIVQIGQNRAGWYSYDILEMLVGAGGFVDGLSANRIIPELQNLKIGDKVYMHPRIPGLTVHTIEKDRLVAFLTRIDAKTGKYFELTGKIPETYVNSSWVFFLKAIDEKTTRLIVRSRYDYDKSFFNFLIWRIFTDPISFVMERRMFLGIKTRAEALQN